jgi:spore germination protein GerM
VLVNCLVLALTVVACASLEQKPMQAGSNETASLPSSNRISSIGGRTTLTLYFRNDNYIPDNPDSKPVIPVTRTVPQEKLTARATLQALITGPEQRERNESAAGPVINNKGLQIDDIYIKNKICVIHLSSPHHLPLYDYKNQTVAQAETVFTQSLVRSLAETVQVEAVWLFQNGDPWQGNTVDWLCPLAPPGGGINYTLYFYEEIADDYSPSLKAGNLKPVQIRLISSGVTGTTECSFNKIIELLSKDYDEAHRAPLSDGVHVLDYTLHDHLLTINLVGSSPDSSQSARVFAKALVYTFTELPEIDALLVTREGQVWSDGNIRWEYPFCRDDFEEKK